MLLFLLVLYIAISPTGIYVTILWCDCHVRAQMAENIDVISFAYDSIMSLPDCAKIGLTSVNPSPPQIFDPPPVDLTAEDNRWQIVAEWLAYRKPPMLF